MPFLDSRIHRQEDQLHLSVYRKPTNSNSFIHYYAFDDVSVKKSVISSMFLRVYRICHASFLDNEIPKIITIYKELQYPQWILKGQLAVRKNFLQYR